MNVVTGLTVYAVLWWGVLYMVMPWGAKPPENPEKGHATSAPAKPHIGRKFLVTTIISGVIWLIINHLTGLNIYAIR